MKNLLLIIMYLFSLSNYAQNEFVYFTQGNRKGSITAYGNNLRQGQYITTSDIKMWCETYDAGEPLFV